MTPRDRDALQLAIDRIRAAGGNRAQQVAEMLAERPWKEVAEFASYYEQMRTLRLRPWEWPPCWVTVDDDEHPEASKLLREMRAAGVSKYHPDPVAAVKKANAAPTTH
jgi:hypothetical protein